jgi:diaminohydroxyphosphoribosylaminopyrimidine deaminase / 5-amino-6-(5-phosphoribosylamino)uracil reductase
MSYRGPENLASVTGGLYNYPMTSASHKWMQRALELAERGRGLVEPNPLVGAVVVKDGAVVGEGWHQGFGLAHAEINAITAAGHAASGATLIVSLEPCCHHGKTPPCTDAIIRAGIARVETALLDPFPAVAGGGIDALRRAGIVVETGHLETEAKRLNAPYLKLFTRVRPYVHAKWAMTLDGKICTRTGESRWISGEPARLRGHALRGRMDAVVIGIGTALADDPLLTARPAGPRTAVRVVLDSRGRLPPGSQLVQTAHQAPVLVVTAAEFASNAVLRRLGCEVWVGPGNAARLSVDALLDELGKRKMTNILVEGGAETLGSFFDAGEVNEIWAFVAPKILGGAGKSPVGGIGVSRLDDAMREADCQVEQVGDDWLFHGRR